jgi:NADH:ubiquinone oxidoreductase subunit H
MKESKEIIKIINIKIIKLFIAVVVLCKKNFFKIFNKNIPFRLLILPISIRDDLLNKRIINPNYSKYIAQEQLCPSQNKKNEFTQEWAQKNFNYNGLILKEENNFFFFKTIVIILIFFVGLLLFTAAFTLLERKLIGLFQRREGPDKIGIEGIGQPFADGLKLVLKDTIVPRKIGAPHSFFTAPIISLTFSLLVWCVLPISSIGAFVSSEVSILIFFAIGSIGSYGTIYAGWASNNKYALLGSMRAIAQFISYEVILSILFIPTLAVISTLDMLSVALFQEKYGWFCYNFFIITIFLVVILAETNRTPFDLPEAEAELVSGFNVEYSSILFAFFFLAEYTSMGAISAIFVIFFLGGFSFNPETTIMNKESVAIKFDLEFFLKKLFSLREDPRTYGSKVEKYDALEILTDNWVFLSIYTWKFRMFPNRYDIFNHIVENPFTYNLSAVTGIDSTSIEHTPLFDIERLISIFSTGITNDRNFFFETCIFSIKIIFVSIFFIFTRASLPRKRFDQLIYLCWKYFFPISIAITLWSIIVYYVFYDWEIISQFAKALTPIKKQLLNRCITSNIGHIVKNFHFLAPNVDYEVVKIFCSSRYSSEEMEQIVIFIDNFHHPIALEYLVDKFISSSSGENHLLYGDGSGQNELNNYLSNQIITIDDYDIILNDPKYLEPRYKTLRKFGFCE